MENYLLLHLEIYFPGITRATVLEICDELGIEVEEKFFSPDELKKADAVFFCGTAAEVIGFESLDDVKFPMPWNKTLVETNSGCV